MKCIHALSVALSVLLLALSLSSCKTIVELGDNGLYDKKNEIKYINASTVYEPAELGKEYGVLKLSDKESHKLFVIEGIDPEKMLATEDGDIVYASDLTMPTLSEMDPAALHICMDTANTTYVIGSIAEKSKIDRIVEAYENPPAIHSPVQSPMRTHRIRFESPDHPGFYYSLTYAEYAEDVVIDGTSYGRYFLLSLFEGIFAPVDNTIREVLGAPETVTETETKPVAETETP